MQSIENALATMVGLDHSNTILNYVVDKVMKYLDNLEILRVTKDEYFTYLTPSDEIYDKSALPR